MIVVYHALSGPESWSCGHWIEVDGQDEHFSPDHPLGQDERAFAERLVSRTLGSERVAELDWNGCLVVGDCD